MKYLITCNKRTLEKPLFVETTDQCLVADVDNLLAAGYTLFVEKLDTVESLDSTQL